jgi:hypothetical protein
MSAPAQHQEGPKYFVNLEGVDKPWESATITVPEIRELAGWEATQQVVEVDLHDNSERTLDESEAVELQPGRGFSKKVKFQRG